MKEVKVKFIISEFIPAKLSLLKKHLKKQKSSFLAFFLLLVSAKISDVFHFCSSLYFPFSFSFDAKTAFFPVS
jgi:hypothetical protein